MTDYFQVPTGLRKILRGVSRGLFIGLRYVFWMLLAVVIYNIALELALTVREYVFQNVCPSDVRYSLRTWHPVTDYHNRVDWCDTYWWHTFRLSTRVYYGFISGALIALSGIVLISMTGIANSLAIRFVILLCLIHTLSILTEVMINYTQNACLKHWYENRSVWDEEESVSEKFKKLTKDDCEKQLGQFGDQRFYFPLATLATFVIARRRVRSSLKSITLSAVDGSK
jgi:hypothetical protein